MGSDEVLAWLQFHIYVKELLLEVSTIPREFGVPDVTLDLLTGVMVPLLVITTAQDRFVFRILWHTTAVAVNAKSLLLFIFTKSYL